ncbi:30S ribosomal protein S16 [Candidatus Poribacteria bacterium]|nr:30S ribosomal protein S16 [Candidatus Poribacteria bacterium]
MAAKIRLQRAGRTKRAFYKIVVADTRANRDGKFVEQLGTYNPVPDTFELVIDEERALYWLRQGAQPSDTVRSLLRQQGVWAQYKGPSAAEASSGE